MKYTSAQAAKLLRKLKDDHQLLLLEEINNRFFLAANGEDVESLRPDYDFDQTQKELAVLEEKIRKVKHAINLFNCRTAVEGKTIDEVLVYLPQLQERRNKLSTMIGRREKQRARNNAISRFSGQAFILDYEYTNYDIRKAGDMYRSVCDEIAALQTALDKANTTGEIEIDL